MEPLEELLFALCRAPGMPGFESDAASAAERELSAYAQVSRTPLGSVTASFGNFQGKKRILLDAHLDQIGLLVTEIDKDGFLHIAPCGGVDRRVLPGCPVTVYGKEILPGILCCLPPHLVEGGEEKVVSTDKMAVDVGLTREEAQKLVSPGDRALFCARPRKLLNGRVTAPALDDRAGCAAVIRAAQLLRGEPLNCEVTVLLSSMEEIGSQGAKTAAFALEPDEAIIVDVSFASQPGVPEEKSGELSGGPMVGISPILSRRMTDRLTELANALKLPCQFEVMGGRTGTNTDSIAMSRGGVACAMLSIPLRNMHTPSEIVDLADVENTARLIAAYVKGVQ